MINNWCIYMKNLFLFLELTFVNYILADHKLYSPGVSLLATPQKNVRQLGYSQINVENLAQLTSIPVCHSSDSYSNTNVNQLAYSATSVSQSIKEANNPHSSLSSLKNGTQGAILLGVDNSYEHAVKHKERLANYSLESYYQAVNDKLHPEKQAVKAKETYHKEPYHRTLPIVSALPQNTNHTEKSQELNQHESEHKSEHKDERNYK